MPSDLAKTHAYLLAEPHATARRAALHRADQRDPLTASQEIPDGSDVCHSCGAVHEEGDLWSAGGEGPPTCTRCVMGTDREYREMRLLLEQAIAVLGISSKTVAAESIIAKGRNLLDGGI